MGETEKENGGFPLQGGETIVARGYRGKSLSSPALFFTTTAGWRWRLLYS